MKFWFIWTLSCWLGGSHVFAQTAQWKGLNELPTEQLRSVLKGFSGDWRKDTDRAKGLPMPPVQKAVAKGAKVLDLLAPNTWELEGAELDGVMNTRRSLRGFSDEALSLKELSFLLWHTQGVTNVLRDEKGAIVEQFRSTPSAGGRYPFETYLAIQRVEGLDPGIYRYLAIEHKLLLVRVSPKLERALRAACYGQAWIGKAPVVFIWAAIPYRTEWKYGFIAHRMIAMEAGHICQNLYLAATALGGGACAVLAYDQSSMDALIGVDGKDEFVMYMAPVGKAKAE